MHLQFNIAKNRSASLFRWMAGFVLCLAFSANAQPNPAPGDSLIGKTLHVYIQDPDFSRIYFDNAPKTNAGATFTIEAQYTYKITLTAAIVSNPGQNDFMIRTDGSFTGEDYKYKITPSGLSTAPTIGKFPTSVFAGHSEIWIIIDPTKPQYDTPPVILFEAPKRVNILNPWATTAPKIVSGTTTRTMSTSPGNFNCGWFSALLLNSTMNKLHFAEINNAAGEVYGQGGLGSAVDYDLTAEFAKHGNEIWLNTQTNVWSKTKPDVDGECQYQMAAVVRDFSREHPDFDFGSLSGDYNARGVVLTTIGANRKPIFNSSASANIKPPITFSKFDQWWTTDSLNPDPKLRNYESCIDIPMSKSSDGSWEYDSYRDSPDHSFFPVEANNKHPEETVQATYFDTSLVPVYKGSVPFKRNGNFCMESHANFIYQPGQKFSFRGDDDVWVFINDKLVVDLGGVHIPQSQTVDMDKQGLKADSTYKWDLFYCDRQPSGSSLRIKTSIYFKQQRALDTTMTVTKVGNTTITTIEIFKLVGGNGSCASVGTTTTKTPPTNLIYELRDAAGAILDTLKTGPSHDGGITITPPKVVVDPDAIRDLKPGKYNIVAYEAANAGLKVNYPFIVPSRSFVDFDPIVPPSGYSLDTLVSAVIPVVAANREGATLVPAAEKYNVVISAGAKVYTDKAMTPASLISSTQLTTELSGLDTLWVTGDPAGPDNQVVTLKAQGSSKTVTITFKLPPPIVVEFQAPFTVDVPVTTVVQVIAATYQKGVFKDTTMGYKVALTNPNNAKVYSDKALTLPVATGASLTTEATGYDTLWVVGDPTAFTDQVVTLITVNSTKSVTVTFRLPPVVLPKILSAGIYDRDANGVGDTIVAVFDSSLVAKPPKQISYAWPQSGTAVNMAGNALTGLVDAAGTLVTLAVDTTGKPKLTAGQGVFTATYVVRGKDTTISAPLTDMIPPLLTNAEAHQGNNTSDTLVLTFSEPVKITGNIPKEQWFDFKTGTDSVLNYAPTTVGWTDGNTTAILVFAAGTPSPQPGQKVRIAPGAGRLADAQGNGVTEKSRYRVIGGLKRTGISSATYLVGDAKFANRNEPAILILRTPLGDSAKKISAETGRLGHLIKIDLGDYVVSDDFIKVTPADVHFKWSLVFYTNTGTYVNSASGDLQCTDPVLFKGDCTQSAYRGNLFLGWNLTTHEGAKCGTGAYIARLKFKAFAGQKVVAEKNNHDERWGFVRGY